MIWKLINERHGDWEEDGAGEGAWGSGKGEGGWVAGEGDLAVVVLRSLTLVLVY